MIFDKKDAYFCESQDRSRFASVQYDPRRDMPVLMLHDDKNCHESGDHANFVMYLNEEGRPIVQASCKDELEEIDLIDMIKAVKRLKANG